MTPAQVLVELWPQIHALCPEIKFQLVPFDICLFCRLVKTSGICHADKCLQLRIIHCLTAFPSIFISYTGLAGSSLYKDTKYIIQYCKDSVVRAKNAMQENTDIIRIGTSCSKSSKPAHWRRFSIVSSKIPATTSIFCPRFFNISLAYQHRGF